MAPSNILAVLSRKIDAASPAGRTHTLSAILGAFEKPSLINLKTLYFRPFFKRRTLREVARLLSVIAQGIFTLRPLALQCLLFFDRDAISEAIQAVGEGVDAVYLDSVRSIFILEALRARYPTLRIVLDLDDLISRRLALHSGQKAAYSLGYVGGMVSPMLRKVIESRLLARLVIAYEIWALKATERRVCMLADAVVLVSEVESDQLRANVGAGKRAQIHTIMPAVRIAREAASVQNPVRFCFIGSDRQLQNLLSIDALLDMWSRLKPAATLDVVGAQQRAPRPADNVRWRGRVDTIEEVYDSHAVLLCLSRLRGGIKTKVLEAFAYGAAAIGNDMAFEGMPIADYPLHLSDEQIEDLVRKPEDWLETFDRAARMGQDYLRRFHDPEVFAQRWRDLVLGLTR